MKLYAHPFSSYSQKVLIALYENAAPFDYRNLGTTTIIEHLQIHHPGAVRLIPDGDAGIEVRLLDRGFDNYVMTPMASETFTLADCAAALSLFHADWAHEIPPTHVEPRAYRARALAHPSVARAVDEARPYRGYFPLGAPDRD